jgi:hypothetical protein
MRPQVFAALVALAVPLASNSGLAATAAAHGSSMRTAAMDANNDGRITPGEWRGTDSSFKLQDRNGDGVLSGDEVRESAPRPAATFTPDRETVGTAGRTVVVDARERWTDARIVVRAGDMLTFQADGSVQLSSNARDVATPAGSVNDRRAANAPFNAGPAGALIVRVGNSAPLLIGDRMTRVRAPAAGRVYLGLNDDVLEDNSGHFRVSVLIQR